MARGVTLYTVKRGFGTSGETKEVDIVFTVIPRLELNELKADSIAFLVMGSETDTSGEMVKKRPLNH